jgi:DNA-binding CsgD family transcriptional regulator
MVYHLIAKTVSILNNRGLWAKPTTVFHRAVAMQDHAGRIYERPALDAGRREEVHRLWDELADFGADQSDQAISRLMEFLCDRAGAWDATWTGAIRLSGEGGDDLLQGWRIGPVQALRAIARQPDEGRLKNILQMWDRREIDPSFLLPMRDVGAFRTYSFRRELPEAWFRSPFYERHYGSIGAFDAVFVAFPLNEDCESHFGFYARKTFADEEIELLAYALRGIKWFHRHLMLSQGLLMASSPLTPTERRVMQLLLTDASEKDIAHRAGMAPSTVHHYVVGLYRKFGVRSRAGLMSLWLSRGG